MTAVEALDDPRRSAFAVAINDVREALARHELWLHQGWIDVIRRYRRTRIGPLWHTLSLGIFIVTMGTIWAAGMGADPVSYFRYVTTSILVWSFISAAILDGANTLISARDTVLSMRFPYPALAFAQVWRGLLLFVHHFLLYVIVAIATGLVPNLNIFLVLPGLVLMIANALWLALLAGIVCLRFRDVIPALGSIMQIMMFATPIFWSKELLGPQMGALADFNPLFHLVRVVREPLLGQTPPAEAWSWAGGFLIVGGTITCWIYGRVRDRLAYWY